MATIAEFLIRKGEVAGLERGLREGREKGKLSEAHDVLLELLEEQFGMLPVGLAEKLCRVRSHGVLRMLRRQRRTCRSLEEFEDLIEKALR